MERRLQTLLSRAWSGSSMIQGVAAMRSGVVVKTELPENADELAAMIKAWFLQCSCNYDIAAFAVVYLCRI